nr:hypothetical protein GCM10017745_35470 [Saccharothrix mutabilis subsp. capreolus]
MTNVLDRELTAVPAQPSAARTQVPGPPEPPFEDRASDLFTRSGLAAQSDRALVATLQAEGFDGPEYREYINSVATYALAVVTAFIRSRRIFQESAKLGRSIAVPDWFVPEDADELATETVAEGLALFQRQLRDGQWDPNHGASLTTYAIGACIRSFPNVFRRYARWHGSWLDHTRASGIVADEFSQRANATRSAEDAVIATHSLYSALANLSRVKRQVLILSAEDMPHREIAQCLGMSTRAVEGQLRRARAELRERLSDGEDRRSTDRNWSAWLLHERCSVGR